jgi:hypothetical protein
MSDHPVAAATMGAPRSGAASGSTGRIGEPTTRQSARTPEEHLRRADPVLCGVIDEIIREDGTACPMLPPDPTLPPDPNMPTDRYGMLVRAIVSQNISNIASRAIYLRLTERFGGRPPTPQETASRRDRQAFES